MAQLTPIRGFLNTPVSKSICVVTIIAAVLLSITELKPYVILALDPLIVVYNQYWRLLVYQLAVINESDLVVVLVVWFTFKNLERFYGSRKYLSLIGLFWFYNALLNFTVMTVGQLLIYGVKYLIHKLWSSNLDDNAYYTPTTFNQVAPGPLGIVSSLYVTYGKFVPISYYFQILFSLPRKASGNIESTTTDNEVDLNDDGNAVPTMSKTKQITLTNQFHIHVIYTLLFLNNGFQSVIPCVVGLVIGKLHTQDILPGSKNWLLPSLVFELFVNPIKLITNVLNGTRNIRRRSRRMGGYQQVSTLGAGGSISPAGNDSSRIAATGSNVSGGDGDDEASDNGDDEDGNDLDDDFDEERQRALQIRAETPIRPLGNQFLDTLRGQ